MTTTAATTSASPSTSNDSPPMQNDIAASETTTPITLDRQRQNQQDNSERSLSSSPQPPPPSSPLPTTQPPQSPQQQNQSPPPQPNNIDQTSTPPNAATTTITTTTTTTTITTLSLSSSASSSPTTSTTTLATPAITSVSTAAINKELQQSPSSQQSQSTNNSSSNNNTEQKRPMNAFLLFCKRQRSLVREKYPNLENRGITKILGDWWSKLDKEQKSKYTDLARQHKEAFMKANPDFKWCKTPNVSNINNNNSSNNNSSNSNDCYANNSPNNHHHQLQQQHQHLNKNQQNHNNSTTTTNAELLSLQSVQHHLDGLHHSSNSMDFTLTSRQQLEAPKPPKKRFLERNDSIYTTRNNFSSNHESNSHSADVVPYISLDQDTLDRVIDKAFSEDSNNSPSGTNTCKCSNRTSTNLTSSLGSTNQASSSSSSSSSAYTAMSVDEPIDFSTNRTINTTRQQIINNLVEKMLSDPTDNASSFSKINGTYSVKSQTGPPVKKDNPDET